MSPKTYDPKSVKISIRDPVTGEEKLVGLVQGIEYGLSYDSQPTYVMGKMPRFEDIKAEVREFAVKQMRRIDYDKNEVVPATRVLVNGEEC